jgi:hypothetical protein
MDYGAGFLVDLYTESELYEALRHSLLSAWTVSGAVSLDCSRLESIVPGTRGEHLVKLKRAF